MVFPEPHDGDAADVRQALERALGDWTSGNADAALTWLRRAAGLATERGADRRAVELFSAAAELSHTLMQRRAAARSSEPLGSALDDAGRTTSVMSKTRLRRAMLAIDPDYAARVDFDPAARLRETRPEHGPIDEAVGSEAAPTGRLEPLEAETERRLAPVERAADVGEPSHVAAAPAAGYEIDVALPAYAVNVVFLRDEGDVCLLFVPPGTTPPAGVASALLVPQSARDAEIIDEIYQGCDAKL